MAQIEVGPWGGDAGDDNWKLSVATSPDNMRLSSITVSTNGHCVVSLAFTYLSNNGTREKSERFGGPGGTPETITFQEDEKIVDLSGTFGPYLGITVITSLKFQTNKHIYEAIGTAGNNRFKLPVRTGGKIAGFFGRHGNLLDSIGAIIVPE